MEKDIIIFEDTSIAFKGFAMSPINMTLKEGYIYGITGDNGAGKSTFLNMLRGIYEKMNGKIYIDGKDVVADRISVLKELAYISENNSFFEEEDAMYNEKVLSSYYDKWNHEEYMEWLKLLKLSCVRRIGNLSKGERIMFQLAFAAAYKPKVLLFDEPTAGLDPVFRENFLRILQKFVAENNTTILLSTHLDEDLGKIVDYEIIIEEGKCIWGEMSI